jgi:hypothetical protein
MAPPPPAAATDTSAAVGTTYATADTTVDANYSEVLSDVPSFLSLWRSFFHSFSTIID